MSWTQRVSAVLLVVLAMLPVTGTVCAVVCDSPNETVSGHHTPGTGCGQIPESSGGPAMATATPACMADAAAPEAAITRVQRSDEDLAPALLTAASRETTFAPPPGNLSRFDYTSPPGSAPPTTIPLVLRI